MIKLHLYYVIMYSVSNRESYSVIFCESPEIIVIAYHKPLDRRSSDVNGSAAPSLICVCFNISLFKIILSFPSNPVCYPRLSADVPLLTALRLTQSLNVRTLVALVAYD